MTPTCRTVPSQLGIWGDLSMGEPFQRSCDYHLRSSWTVDIKSVSLQVAISILRSCMNMAEVVLICQHPLVAEWILDDRSQISFSITWPWDLSEVLVGYHSKALWTFAFDSAQIANVKGSLPSCSCLHHCVPFSFREFTVSCLGTKPRFLAKNGYGGWRALLIHRAVRLFREPTSPLEQQVHLMFAMRALQIYLCNTAHFQGVKDIFLFTGIRIACSTLSLSSRFVPLWVRQSLMPILWRVVSMKLFMRFLSLYIYILYTYCRRLTLLVLYVHAFSILNSHSVSCYQLLSKSWQVKDFCDCLHWSHGSWPSTILPPLRPVWRIWVTSNCVT